jgi:hypothetical protein
MKTDSRVGRNRTEMTMKKLLFFAGFLAIVGTALAQSSVYVRPYLKKDGTLVQGHFRSAPNETVFDNWSVYPNINPYTGELGTKNPWTEYLKQLERKSSSYYFNYYVPRAPSENLSGSYLDSYQNYRSSYYDSPIYLPNLNVPPVPSSLELQDDTTDDTTPYDELDSPDTDPDDD